MLQPAQRLQVSTAIRGSVLWPFLELHRAFAERARLQDRFDRTRAERDSLVGELLGMRALAEQGRQLEDLARLDPPALGSFLPARITPGRPRVGDSDVFFLWTPDVDHIEPPVGAIAGGGLVGVVRTVTSSGALGEFWTHPEFRVSVKTEIGGIAGIVRARRGSDGGAIMLLEGAPYQEEIAPGTALLTTGIAGIYPPGITVGTVRSVFNVESGWSKSYIVSPAVRPEAVDVVLVWQRPAVQP
ncbi:MAG: rod shape-determining protein MreC [Gemmatimonadota bacterium]